MRASPGETSRRARGSVAHLWVGTRASGRAAYCALPISPGVIMSEKQNSRPSWETLRYDWLVIEIMRKVAGLANHRSSHLTFLRQTCSPSKPRRFSYGIDIFIELPKPKKILSSITKQLWNLFRDLQTSKWPRLENFRHLKSHGQTGMEINCVLVSTGARSCLSPTSFHRPSPSSSPPQWLRAKPRGCAPRSAARPRLA